MLNQWNTLKKVLVRIRRYWPTLIAAIVLATVNVGMTLYMPILVGNAIDCIVDTGNVDFDRMWVFLRGVILCAAIGGLSQWVMSELCNRMTFQVTRDIRNEAFRHIQVLPISYIDQHAQGDLVSRVIADVDTFADGLLMGFTQLFTGVMTILGTLVFMMRIHWGTALVVVCITPLSLVVANFIATRTYSMFRLQTVTRGEQTSLIDETIGNIKVVQAFGHEDASMEQFDEINGRLQKASLRAIFFSSLVNPCTRFVNSLAYAGVGLTGALMAIAGGITVGNLTSFLNYANQYTKPFNEISGVVTELQNALACSGRVFELIEAPARSPEPEHPQCPDPVKGAVDIRNLKFSYVPEKPLIDNFNLSVRPGQRIAIVGPTGCGKTTFINLLMRFYDPQGGEIRLDGINTMDMNRGRLRRCVGMVLQDTWLKAGTIRENIAMGKPDATQEEIETAAKQAHAHSFIRRLPEGYDTVISEAGGNLSQGQKQLLCIARVMLCLPPMLFLDEATSSIDTRTEIRIQKAFDTMMQGRTSFIVAHRLSTIQGADLILVMRDGHIVEQGKHEELLQKRGFYAQLYMSQFAH
ncbi:MAG TPA: ABC transporter ATP-binding protein [Candidatus Faecousia intestinavium]|nr:ABC transporter ATP-binding protein [Candidatus Faecousia intestinavium]